MQSFEEASPSHCKQKCTVLETRTEIPSFPNLHEHQCTALKIPQINANKNAQISKQELKILVSQTLENTVNRIAETYASWRSDCGCIFRCIRKLVGVASHLIGFARNLTEIARDLIEIARNLVDNYNLK
jgi:hypothetical protein